jgi:hypothetical protein
MGFIGSINDKLRKFFYTIECLWDCPTQKDAEDLADQAQAMLQEAGILEYDWRTGKEMKNVQPNQ